MASSWGIFGNIFGTLLERTMSETVVFGKDVVLDKDYQSAQSRHVDTWH